ncbi:hypothetical protein NIES267_54140 [Calothrix parasitica NIES-267]|uniref:Uncharacterized protein n=1 Tax=Calothrix parasitica NIES-267 TaxID=1973488 RepID=A0A1Z4LXU6_9CYAN|nr:hypothetical protein NIES267_54140 [Calothrix parasitica NIES-267]
MDKLTFIVDMLSLLFNHFNRAIHTNYKLIKTDIVKY